MDFPLIFCAFPFDLFLVFLDVFFGEFVRAVFYESHGRDYSFDLYW